VPINLPEFRLAIPFDTPDGDALATEWLLTDGRGGFAMGTASGVPTRRYHALFIAATKPPVGRMAMLNATADELTVHPGTPQALPIALSSFRFAGDAHKLHPDGASRISSFKKGLTVEWVYDLPVARVTRTLHLHRDPAIGPAATLRYVVERTEHAAGRNGSAAAPLRLSIRPLVSLRDFHAMTRRAHSGDCFSVHPAPDGRACRVNRDNLTLHLRADTGSFTHDQQWWFDFLCSADASRGQDCVEDLFSPGHFTLDLAPNQRRAELLLRASIADLPAPTLADLERDLDARQSRLARAATFARTHAPALTPESAPLLGALIAAADDFVVARAAAGKSAAGSGVSTIAGYPWFSDWGRDTFISLPGLMLATGRFDDARATLLAFAAHRRTGLIPNVFNDQTGEAEYNTVDGSLWFIQAACSYLAATGEGDRDTWRKDLAPACLDIIAHYRKGTGGETNIAMDPFDRLITAGTSATQLTWMDARRDGVVFTPRHGKAVEINALWISGLSRLAEAIGPDDSHQAANLHDLAAAASRSFTSAFWNAAAGCLFDVLTPSDSERGAVTWNPDAAIRPNQIFAVSLPHSPLSPQQQRAVIACVKQHLLTPRGLRTLSPADSRYRPRYEGNLFQRDTAYHQGTAWPWLLGPLAEAVLRVDNFSPDARREALAILRPLLSTLDPATFRPGPDGGGCPGHIAEIYDGDSPQRPQGCPAQAWSTAEFLRVLALIHR
jgi:predicted glycogen debranching enzyme